MLLTPLYVTQRKSVDGHSQLVNMVEQLTAKMLSILS